MKGIGVDIIESKRFRGKHYTRRSSLLKQMFTAHELTYCFSKRDAASHFATHFAAKEALWKAMSESKKFTTPLYLFLKEVEVVHDLRGKPGIVFLNNHFKKHHALVSLSTSDSHAIAVVVLKK